MYEIEALESSIEASPKITKLPGWCVSGETLGTFQDCSLVVPTYKRQNEVAGLLKAISRLPDRPGEIVVVDGSEDDNTETAIQALTKVQKLKYNLSFVRSPKGLTLQRNVGIDISRGEFIFFLDDDCMPKPGYFSEMRGVFLRDIEKQVGAVTGLIVNEMNRPLPRRWRLRMALGLIPRLPPRIFHPSGTSIPRNTIPCFSGVKPVDIVDGGASAWRRDVFTKQRFSEFFYGYAQGEDMEMSLRIRPQWKILWCGDAHVDHNHAQDGRPTSYTKGFMEVWNRHFIWRRYAPNAKVVDRMRFWMDVLFLIVMDWCWFMCRPTRPEFLRHSLGLAIGAIRCAIAPARYCEPLVRTRYAIA